MNCSLTNEQAEVWALVSEGQVKCVCLSVRRTEVLEHLTITLHAHITASYPWISLCTHDYCNLFKWPCSLMQLCMLRLKIIKHYKRVRFLAQFVVCLFMLIVICSLVRPCKLVSNVVSHGIRAFFFIYYWRKINEWALSDQYRIPLWVSAHPYKFLILFWT